MKCHRCDSVMANERFYGLIESFLGRGCILCGEIIDQVVLENLLAGVGRQKQHTNGG